MGTDNSMFWSETGLGFGEPSDTPLPRIHMNACLEIFWVWVVGLQILIHSVHYNTTSVTELFGSQECLSTNE